MVETFAGLLALFFGWVCLSHVARVRARYSEDSPRRSHFHGEKPLMIVPSALGVLLVINGLALLALAAVEWLKISGMSVPRQSSGVIITLALGADLFQGVFTPGCTVRGT